ncbi:MAG: hypothetical protein ACREA0_22060 [bacterium]
MRFGTIALAAMLVTLSVACPDSLGFEPIVPCSDAQMVTVAVETDGTPRFTWQPACGMSSLQVLPDTGSSGGWVVYSGSHAAENPLPSGIRYGHLPPFGVAPGGAHPLIHGVPYHVTVYRWIGPPGGPGSIFERGTASFLP